MSLEINNANFLRNHIEFWRKFKEVAFSNKAFEETFHNRRIMDRAYYDLAWDYSGVHLVLRCGISNQSIEIYVEKDVDLYNYLLLHKKEIDEYVRIESLLDNPKVLKNQKHRKLIFEYDGKLVEEVYIAWLIETSIVIKEIVCKVINGKNIVDNYLDYDLVFEISSQPIKQIKEFNYTKQLKKRTNPIFLEGIKQYKRDKQISLNALNHAKFMCEIDKKHKTFIKRSGKIPYTEPHHLIPMAYQEDFEYSLDVEENIVSLCSNCHNEIHYGINAKKLITKLYYERIELLKNKKIGITLDKLLSYYDF